MNFKITNIPLYNKYKSMQKLAIKLLFRKNKNSEQTKQMLIKKASKYMALANSLVIQF